MSAVVWIHEDVMPIGVGAYTGMVGAYTGMDKKNDALTQEIIARRGATDSESLEKYGQIAGAIGAGAACASFVVTAPLAGGCAIVGGIIGGWIGKHIPVAKGSTIYDFIDDKWNNYVAPHAKLSARAMLKVKAYLTMRDLAITQGKTDAWLTSQGLPGAPVDPRWAPSAKRYAAAKAYAEGPPIKTEECDAAAEMGIISASSGITCRTYYWLSNYLGNRGPVAAPGDPIDWWAVGRDEIAYYHLKKNGKCIPADLWYYSGDDTNYDTMWVRNDPADCPKDYPSAVADAYLVKLKSIVEYKPIGYVPRPSGKRGAGPGPVLVVGGLAAAAALAWWLLA